MKKKLRMIGLLGILGLVSLAAWGPSLGQKEKVVPEHLENWEEFREVWHRAEEGDAEARSDLVGAWEKYEKFVTGRYLKWDPLEEVRDEGGAESKAELARRYRLGEGVEQDFAKAKQLAFEALEAGAYGAYTDLGELYLYGDGVPQSDTEALRLFREGARRGVASAQRGLGDMYREGCGVEASAEEALSWYSKAAALGDALAATSLGQMYTLGQGVEEDGEEALRWFIQAAEQGEAGALFMVSGVALELADPGALGLEQVEGWLHRAAAQGHEDAVMALSNRYTLGELGPRRLQNPSFWPGQVRDLDDAQFITNLVAATAATSACESACGEFLKQAVAMGDPRAGLNLGLLYATGEGVESSLIQAVRHFRNAAAAGLPEAMNEVGACYATGKGVRRDLEQAAEWYRKAAAAGDLNGSFNLAMMHAHGEGLEQDMPEAYRWMELAAAEGDAVSVAMRDALAVVAGVKTVEEVATEG